MRAGDGVILTVLLLAVLLLAAWYERKRRARAAAAAASPFCSAPGPYNLGLHDAPYFYPRYRAQALTAWDLDQRCSASCSAGGCAVWCR